MNPSLTDETMSLMKSIRIGMSGLDANSRALGVVGDNIANANTAGFKASRANFADVLAGTQLGSGVQIGSYQQNFAQGDMEMTGNALDLAISGPGFLMVKGEVGGQEGTFYTRAGQFMLDADGYVTSPGGLRLQGYGTNEKGDVNMGALGDLQLGNMKQPAKSTESIDIDLNLSATETPITDPFDPANPTETSHHSTSVTIYDSVGRPIDAEVYYTMTAPGEWSYNVLVDGESLDGGTAGTAQAITSGTLSFDTDGNLTTHTPGATTFNPINATQPQTLAFDFEGSTQVAGDSSLRALSQDGYAPGELRDIEINDRGEIIGIFSNGENQTVGRVAMTDFQAPEGLNRLGGNLWGATAQSGEALVGAPGTGKMGGLVSGAIEGSNVDMSYEFVKMIAFQRGFQASSKSITTGDQLLNEVINLKR
tara:strand:+ start:72 stop:1340 length:1269 start_codon:yes stop_codon:yes gene_type:complete